VNFPQAVAPAMSGNPSLFTHYILHFSPTYYLESKLDNLHTSTFLKRQNIVCQKKLFGINISSNFQETTAFKDLIKNMNVFI
jgi:hypothetical protein